MPASPRTARAINDRLALRLLQDEGPLTAGQLKQLTGLSRPTVADLVERLTVSGLIEVVGEAGEQRRGPNAKLYGIVADRAHLAALDLRTEGVAVLVTDLVGRVLAEASVPIGGDTGTGPAVEQAVTLVERVVKEAGADRLHTVGIGAPGLIDPASGELRDSTGLPAWHRRLAAALQERLPQARVSVENETNLAALAEQREGVARDRDTFVLLWLGHGTGAAVVLDGALRRGASGGTGEIGFLPVPGTGGLPSATDCEGGFHSLAGSAAIVALAAEHGLEAGPEGDEPRGAAVVRGAVRAVGGDHRLADGVGAVGAVGAVPVSAAVAGAGDETPSGREAPPGREAGSVTESVAGSVAGSGRGTLPGDAAGPGGGTPPEYGAPPERGSGSRSGAEPEQAPVSAGPGGGTPPEYGAPPERGPGSGAVPVPVPVPVPEPMSAGPGREPPPGRWTPPEHETPLERETPPGWPAESTPAASREVRPVPGRPEAVPDAVRADAAARFLDALADRVAIGVASVVAVLDPGCVVLGGEVGRAGGEVLAARVEERLRRMAPLPTEVRPSSLGGGAVLRGALLTARGSAQAELFGKP